MTRPSRPRHDGLRWFLRQGTQALHDRADALGGRYALATAPGYRAFLRAHARALPALEAACDRQGLERAVPDWSARRRTAALAGDMAALAEPMPPPLPLPAGALASLPAALGAAYVLEGSRLGNAMLLRGVIRDAAGRVATAYLSHAPAAGGWPAFIAMLEQALPEPDAWPEALAGACAAFNQFLAALQGEDTEEALLNA
ncbi:MULTISPECIES: biliverdin-producing heme oxygenase [Acetobacterales]|uniref:biliverdin-producing heme oxygenase n=1 Tax=Roseomonas sp. WGS1072 TaxID=3366816 RepID=UPI003BF3CAAF